MSETYPFARFWRCALQVNPAGYLANHRGGDHGLSEASYNQALLEQCQKQDIRVVGMADHGSVASIDATRKVLEPAGIVVFPGFEIASNDKTHFVCLFAEDTTSQMLERYLGHLQLLSPENGVRPSRLSSVHLIEQVVDQLGGFIYAAHCTEDRGLLKQRLSHVWQLSRLRAAQIPGSIEDLKGIEDDFYRRVFLNKDKAYEREHPMAAINAKDVAKPSDLEHPGATCWIKMTQPTFSAFKVAFLDPESRVRLNSERPEDKPSAVHSVRVSGGYLDGMNAVLSGHLDTVIGGRGTGKSTLIECLRFVLDMAPKGTQARKQHAEIIKENLGREMGRVEVHLTSFTQHGRRYTVTRRFGEAPIVRDAEGQVSTLNPRDLLPELDIYGQNEIYELAQDESSRLRLLERFLPHDQDGRAQSDQVQKRLRENADKLTKAFDDADTLYEQVNRLPKLQEQLQSYEALGLKDKLARVPLLERERQIDTRAQEELKGLQTALTSLQDALPDTTFISDKALEGLPHAAKLAATRVVLDGLRDSMMALLRQGQGVLDKATDQMRVTRQAWQSAQSSAQAEIDGALRSLPSAAGRTGQQIGVEYQKLQQEIERIRPLRARVSTFAQLIETLEQERRNLLAELSDHRHARLQALQSAAKKLNRRLDGRLRVHIQPEGDRRPLRNFLLDCKLEGVGERRLAWIDERRSFSTIELAKSIREGKGDLGADWGLTPMVADALSKLPRAKLMALESLELEHRVGIELNVAQGDAPPNYKPLDRLSTGQQCTAILHLLLLDNPDPLVMDQPEDNLDNAFIADRIVRELRKAKTHRQFIFATHNANIPVFGDAEWIGVFSATESHGSLGAEAQGSIDVPAIRDSVATILEGGRDAFMQRKAKYEF
ncbi:TrlF family AAA-like ATPase [Variovorax sp. JS1663]|uniref:TrlF family AAA-like ATPase n=1 Tax=Variovorax sp. JS1663 TaxID=1851577 RepID=UPI000B348C23|nr:AAA family ATPase [Variovorax sp. JS1663]OUL99746.1 ATPase [Variovorax sp. JS1663]